MTESPEHPNAVAYRRTADAFRAGDLVALRSLIAEDVVWHVPGRHPMAGEVRGLEDLVAWLGRLRALGFTLREHDVFGNDEHVCALSYMGARRPGTQVEVRVTSVFHYQGGRQVERWMYPEDMAAWDAIFGG
jgi:ketosteroid isomerase-like protein